MQKSAIMQNSADIWGRVESDPIASVGSTSPTLPPTPNSHSPAALSVPHTTPRFRALALFGRRLSERGDGLGKPASENLHKSGNHRFV
jgi:hypothetical protein